MYLQHGSMLQAKHKEMSETVHTAITTCTDQWCGDGGCGTCFCPEGRWRLMGTPEDVIDQSALYMRIYFLGMPFFMLYNYGAAILRAVGDTKRPLIFLIMSGVTNAVLNMILVIVFHLGCGRCSHCDGNFPDDFLCSGASVPV